MDSQARLARVKIWIDAYEWRGHTTKRNVIDSLMNLESERVCYNSPSYSEYADDCRLGTARLLGQEMR
jgi:hypothetical protein